MSSTGFQELGLRPELMQAIAELEYVQPTRIQEDAIPALLTGCDLMGQAQTGTGKTAAFALPMLNKLDLKQASVQGLVLAPTRELANQVSNAIYRYGQYRQVQVLPIYGGQSYTRQIRRLGRGVDIVVGTPGRTLDLIQKNILDLSNVRFLVLDEADEMLTMGFIDDVEAILGETPSTRQTALFSATLPRPVRHLADRYMRDPREITVGGDRLTVEQTEQQYYVVHEADKLAALVRLLEVEPIDRALVFTRTKIRTAQLAESLLERSFQAEALHGDLDQPAREAVLRRVRRGQTKVLVATDVAARGLDIEGISHVINYDLPGNPEYYVHRIGRTGRAGNSGIAIALTTPREQRYVSRIGAFIRQPISRHKLPSINQVLAHRNNQFRNQLSSQLEQDDISSERMLVNQMIDAGHDPIEIAAAAMQLARTHETNRPLPEIRESFQARRGQRQKSARSTGRRARHGGKQEPGMVLLAINAGKANGIRPGDVVGAIASEAGIPGKSIGAIDIYQHQTFVAVSDKHSRRVLGKLSRFTLRGRPVALQLADQARQDVRRLS